MAALNLTALIRELQAIEVNIRKKAGMPPDMPICLPCRAALDLSSMRYDVVKATVRLGDCVLLHFFKEDS